jgi:hypothetical protein
MVLEHPEHLVPCSAKNSLFVNSSSRTVYAKKHALICYCQNIQPLNYSHDTNHLSPLAGPLFTMFRHMDVIKYVECLQEA